MRYEPSIYEMGKSGFRASIDRKRRWKIQSTLWNIGIPGAIQAARTLSASRKAEKEALEASQNVVTQPTV